MIRCSHTCKRVPQTENQDPNQNRKRNNRRSYNGNHQIFILMIRCANKLFWIWQRMRWAIYHTQTLVFTSNQRQKKIVQSKFLCDVCKHCGCVEKSHRRAHARTQTFEWINTHSFYSKTFGSQTKAGKRLSTFFISFHWNDMCTKKNLKY